MAGLGTVLGDSISELYSLVTLEESDTFFIFHTCAWDKINGNVNIEMLDKGRWKSEIYTIKCIIALPQHLDEH
jgi:hypothetical protein